MDAVNLSFNGLIIEILLDTGEIREWVCRGELKDAFYGKEIIITPPKTVSSGNKTVVITYGGCRTSFDLTIMKNGKLDTKFSGKVTISGKSYTIKNGKVV